MTTSTSRTIGNRIYTVRSDNVSSILQWQRINPATGSGWRAIRGVADFRGSNHEQAALDALDALDRGENALVHAAIDAAANGVGWMGDAPAVLMIDEQPAPMTPHEFKLAVDREYAVIQERRAAMTPHEFKLAVDREYAVIQERRAADAAKAAESMVPAQKPVASTKAASTEKRGDTRRRLIKMSMDMLKRGKDQEEVMQEIWQDRAAAAILESMENDDERYCWARGIVNFCESALGLRDRH